MKQNREAYMLSRMWRDWHPCESSRGMPNGAASVKNCMAIPQKLKIALPHDLAIPFLSIYPKEMKAET